MEEFNVDKKAECGQRTVIQHTKLKQTNASAHLVQYRFKIREGSLKRNAKNVPNYKVT